jgi:hypothetical protein
MNRTREIWIPHQVMIAHLGNGRSSRNRQIENQAAYMQSRQQITTVIKAVFTL